eukprot:scaffold119260_cov45-Phaeocystis_antarctica.AAC.1
MAFSSRVHRACALRGRTCRHGHPPPSQGTALKYIISAPNGHRAKMRNPKAASVVRLSTHSLLAAHALNLSPHDARRATDADPAGIRL